MVAEWRRSKSRRVRDFGSLDEATKKPRGVTRAARPRRRRRDQEHRGRREECVRASEAVNAARARVPAPFRVANTARDARRRRQGNEGRSGGRGEAPLSALWPPCEKGRSRSQKSLARRTAACAALRSTDSMDSTSGRLRACRQQTERASELLGLRKLVCAQRCRRARRRCAAFACVCNIRGRSVYATICTTGLADDRPDAPGCSWSLTTQSSAPRSSAPPPC